MIYGHVGHKFNVIFDMSKNVLSFRNCTLQLNIKNCLFVILGYIVIILVLVS